MTPEAAPLTLSAFLAARLDEDEAAARRRFLDFDGDGRYDVHTCGESTYERSYLVVDPARVLADVAARRAIVENERNARSAASEAPIEEQIAAHDGPAAAYWRGQDWVLRVLATAYRGHPDYDTRWEPYGGPVESLR